MTGDEGPYAAEPSVESVDRRGNRKASHGERVASRVPRECIMAKWVKWRIVRVRVGRVLLRLRRELDYFVI